MPEMPKTKIKICGLSRPCDIEYVNAAKPDWCGFIINFPKSHRNITPEQARLLRKNLDQSVIPVGVFVDETVENVAALLLDGTISIAQLHGGEDEAYIAALRAAAPGFPIWKAFRIRDTASINAARISSADMVLLDGGQGDGKTFDWLLAANINRPFLLAGGLNPDNISQAIRAVRPYGIDLSSGVETGKLKDFAKIKAAVAAAKTAGME